MKITTKIIIIIITIVYYIDIFKMLHRAPVNYKHNISSYNTLLSSQIEIVKISVWPKFKRGGGGGGINPFSIFFWKLVFNCGKKNF